MPKSELTYEEAENDEISKLKYDLRKEIINRELDGPRIRY